MQDVVVYGASGYTGQLICEFLARFGVPFTAAGRNQAKLDGVVKTLQAHGAVCTARATEHSDTGLRELLKDAKVVVNVSGPFSLLGEAVVAAALHSGCHYLDTTGEQDFMLDIRRKYDALFRAKTLLLSPSTAFLWGVGTLAADLCLQVPGISDLEIVYAPPSLQTIASLQSMWRFTRREAFSLRQGRLHKLPTAQIAKKTLPDGRTLKAVRLGSGEPTFLMADSRVQNCEVYFASNTLARVVPMFRFWKVLESVVSGETLDRWSDALVERFKRNPGREEPESGRFVIDTTGKGPGGTVHVVMNGTSPYLLTGFLGAAGAQAVVQGRQIGAGYVSLAAAFGTDYLLKRLEEIGTTVTVTKHAAPALSKESATTQQNHVG